MTQTVPTRAAVTGADRRTLDRVFQHPLSHNLAWRDVTGLIASVGSVVQQHNGDVLLVIGADRLPVKKPRGHDLAPDEVMALRHFLQRAGWAPGDAAAPDASTAPADIVIVIDHEGARVYHIAAAGSEGAVPQDMHHLHHHIDRKAHDADRAEHDPADSRFFDQVAATTGSEGRIAVIGHGTGQSNEAAHLTAHLLARHKAIHARIGATLVADMTHLSLPELLDLGRRALAPAATIAETRKAPP